MEWYNNLKTQSKLLLMVVIITLVSALAITSSLFGILALHDTAHEIEAEARALALAAQAQTYVLEQEIAVKNLLLTTHPYYKSQYNQFGDQIDDYVRTALSAADTVDRRDDLASLAQHQGAFAKAIAETEASFDLERMDAASRVAAVAAVDLEADRVQERLLSIIYKGDLALQALLDEANGLVALLLLVGIAGLVLLSGLVVAASIGANQVAEPMLHLTNAVVAFECNTYDPTLLAQFMRRRDETGQLVRAFDAMVRSITETRQAQQRFLDAAMRFVPNQYLDLLEKESIVDLKLGDHEASEMAVMFSDIRSFTTLSERMSPQQNFDFVNAYLELVSPIIQKHDGFVVKFLGDGMMAVFPFGVDDAVQAGIEKQKQVELFNAKRQAQGLPPIDVGIGIHTGHMMVGMIGEEMRIQGDAFSDNVNLTARIEGLTKILGISMIVSQETVFRLEQPARYQMRYLGKAQVKGREQPITLYDVFEGEPEALRRHKLETRDDFERGLKRYRAGHLAEAKSAFESVLERYPDDRAAAFYLNRTIGLMAHGLPEEWEGVEVMTEK
ncbi:MAG: adenylate/guanylate cyclase domain-containing protein [Anaerolineae bacterium]|nr:adenylate/guanylate cyclase domain-containing protein [Anaerolineae bacterium]